MVREVLSEVLSGSSEDSSKQGLLGPEPAPGRRDGGPDHWNLCEALRESYAQREGATRLGKFSYTGEESRGATGVAVMLGCRLRPGTLPESSPLLPVTMALLLALRLGVFSGPPGGPSGPTLTSEGNTPH